MPFVDATRTMAESLSKTACASVAKMLRTGKQIAKGLSVEDKEAVLAAAGSEFESKAVKPARLVAAMTALRTMFRAC